jgi:hypothetical protein
MHLINSPTKGQYREEEETYLVVFKFFVQPKKTDGRQLINSQDYRGENKPVNIEFRKEEKDKEDNTKNRKDY